MLNILRKVFPEPTKDEKNLEKEVMEIPLHGSENYEKRIFIDCAVYLWSVGQGFFYNICHM